MACVALTGLKGEALLEPLADLILAVPSTDTPRIQEMHALLGHILCEAVEQILFPHP
jgi:D-sedoheptulose 7-phosphate isomerase